MGARDTGGTRHLTASILVAAVAAVAVYATASFVFPYLSTNHDEGVYLQQASMLLDGQLTMSTSPGLVDSFRPWFFVVDGTEMYPKYSPVSAAVFALGKLIGSFAFSLAAVAFANVLLVYLVVREAFDDVTGVTASALLAVSPFFLVNSSLFLPYATTTAFNLVFAFAYVRSVFHGKTRYAALAGVSVGVAFFSRPYTAVLFASPFIVHSVYSLYSRFGSVEFRDYLTNYAVIALGGTALVVVTLAYNDLMTGSPLVFPYLEFAPRDGLGFGERAILGYERVYTPELALRSNAIAVWDLATDWTTAGIVGASVALVGGVLGLVRRDGTGTTQTHLRLILVGVFVAVVVGNVYFWGTLNVLGGLDDPTDGMISLYGPYYHYDLLLPVSAFMAFGLVSAYRRLSSLDTRVAVVIGLVPAVVFAGVAVAEVDEKIETNAEVTEFYGEAYRPFEESDFENALVFLPTPMGDWLNHPFQYLRNSPDIDGDAVYALDMGDENFEVIDAYPNRTYYRYSYRGDWDPLADAVVLEPDLERIEAVEGGTVEATTVVDSENVSTASVRLSSGGNSTYVYASPNETFEFRLRFGNGTVWLGNSSVALDPDDGVSLTVHLTRGYLDEVSYRQRFDVRTRGGRVTLLSPTTEYCAAATGCRGETAYVSADEGEAGIRTEITAVSSRVPRGTP